MRLALRVLLNVMNSIDAQLDQVSNEMRHVPNAAAYRPKFAEAHRALRLAIRAFNELNDSMGDAGIN
jgi:hypothetical protein